MTGLTPYALFGAMIDIQNWPCRESSFTADLQTRTKWSLGDGVAKKGGRIEATPSTTCGTPGWSGCMGSWKESTTWILGRCSIGQETHRLRPAVLPLAQCSQYICRNHLSHAENLPPRKLKLRSRKLCVSFGVSQTFPSYVISMLRKQSLQWRKVA